MCQAVDVVPDSTSDDLDPHEVKRAAIHVAAIAQFSTQGIAATSMANIAEAAGMSRPALYQYFSNKGDIFASAFITLFEEHVDRALTALNGSGTTAARIDDFLQRFEGDLWERLAATRYPDEFAQAKSEHVAVAVAGVVTRLWDGFDGFLAYIDACAPQRDGWTSVLRYSPAGLKSDKPSVDEFRQRLSALARSVAADIDAR